MKTGNIYANSGPDYYPWNTCLLFYAFLWGILHIPFAVVDLYYAYRDVSCVHVSTGDFIFTFYTWLQVDGYVIVGFFIILLFVGALGIPYVESRCTYVWWQFFLIIFMLWRIAWLIIGSIMFWKYLNPMNMCHFGIRRYLWGL